MEPEIRYATTSDGVSIAYYSMGEGMPLVATSNLVWANLNLQSFREYHRSRSGKGLGRGLQVVRYDARGTGLSDRQPIDFSMEARLRDLECVIDRVSLTRFALLGQFHGAAAAIAYALRHSERVSHLILVNPYARGRDWGDLTRWGESMRAEADEQWERFTLTVANDNLGFSDSELARTHAGQYRESMTPESYRAWFATLDDIDLTPLLPHVAVPTLVMYRSNPTVGAMEWSREVASKIPDARFVTTRSGDSGRWTDEETRIVEDFLGVKPEAPNHETMPSSPSRMAHASRTILFTDIEGNTDLLQRLGDEAWRAVLRDHERITP